jgi:hypothetical protein
MNRGLTDKEVAQDSLSSLVMVDTGVDIEVAFLVLTSFVGTIDIAVLEGNHCLIFDIAEPAQLADNLRFLEFHKNFGIFVWEFAE